MTFRIVTIGDSNTATPGIVGATNVWPHVLLDLLTAAHPGQSYELTNSALAGYTFAEFLAAGVVASACLDYDPHIVIIALGTNDTYSTLADYETNYRSYIEQILAHMNGDGTTPKLVLVQPPIAMASVYGTRSGYTGFISDPDGVLAYGRPRNTVSGGPADGWGGLFEFKDLVESLGAEYNLPVVPLWDNLDAAATAAGWSTLVNEANAYLLDGVHLTSVSHALLAAYVLTAMDALLNPVLPRVPVTAPRLSLLVGSDALGWADLGAGAVVGERTKGMPGGDGSLTFTLPPDVAAKARNQLQHKARVKLTANGAPDWTGRICSDPFGDVLSPVKDAVTVECSGLWAWADRYGAFAWVWHDTDTSQWSTTGQQFDAGDGELVPLEGVERNKFDADTEGRLFIRADSSAAFSAQSRFNLNYWLLGGLGMGCEIVRLSVAYKCNLPVLMADGMPGPWRLWFYSSDNPWDVGWVPLGAEEATTRDSWYVTAFDLDPGDPNQGVSMCLQRVSPTAWAGPEPEVISDPWVWVQTAWVICRLGLTGDDTAGFLTDALCDMATRPGLATVTRGEDVYSLAESLQLAVRSMTSIRSGLLDVASLYSGELEYWFDLDENGADRFNHYERPAACDPTRNSVWHYGDAAGESVAGLDHDPELCPDWVRMTYLSDGVATIPNGTPRDVWYPATPPTDCSASVRVITEFGDRPFTDAHAAALAQRVHARIAASEWSGSVPVPFTMTDVAGRERGGWQVQPGDRISVPSLDGADDLYVTEASWNWTTLTGSATVGYPWEVAGMLGPDAAAAAPFVTPPLPEQDYTGYGDRPDGGGKRRGFLPPAEAPFGSPGTWGRPGGRSGQ